jgi:hypothetical protein
MPQKVLFGPIRTGPAMGSCIKVVQNIFLVSY